MQVVYVRLSDDEGSCSCLVMMMGGKKWVRKYLIVRSLTRRLSEKNTILRVLELSGFGIVSKLLLVIQ